MYRRCLGCHIRSDILSGILSLILFLFKILKMYKKFEYTFRTIKPIEDRMEILNNYGQDGWEVVHMSFWMGTANVYFKREIV